MSELAYGLLLALSLSQPTSLRSHLASFPALAQGLSRTVNIGETLNFSAVGLISTNKPLDIAIEGKGYLKILTHNGEPRYTRDGQLTINTNGNLVNQDGFAVDPAITLPQDAVSVSVAVDGTVSVVRVGSDESSVTLGQLTLTRFPNSSGLKAEGSKLLSETDTSGEPILGTPGEDGAGRLHQGFLNRDNLDALNTAIHLLRAKRSQVFNGINPHRQ